MNLDLFTAETLRAMIRTSRWSDDRIARYLGIAPALVTAMRDRTPQNAGGTGYVDKVSAANRRAAA